MKKKEKYKMPSNAQTKKIRNVFPPLIHLNAETAKVAKMRRGKHHFCNIFVFHCGSSVCRPGER